MGSVYINHQHFSIVSLSKGAGRGDWGAKAPPRLQSHAVTQSKSILQPCTFTIQHSGTCLALIHPSTYTWLINNWYTTLPHFTHNRISPCTFPKLSMPLLSAYCFGIHALCTMHGRKIPSLKIKAWSLLVLVQTLMSYFTFLSLAMGVQSILGAHSTCRWSPSVCCMVGREVGLSITCSPIEVEENSILISSTAKDGLRICVHANKLYVSSIVRMYRHVVLVSSGCPSQWKETDVYSSQMHEYTSM